MASADDIGIRIYQIITGLVGFITFWVSWIYCISEYGYLFGVGLGWLPSLIVAAFAAALWPLALIGLLFFFVYLHNT
jgi:hypothetical protein